jgi:hypothetical protein
LSSVLTTVCVVRLVIHGTVGCTWQYVALCNSWFDLINSSRVPLIYEKNDHGSGFSVSGD